MRRFMAKIRGLSRPALSLAVLLTVIAWPRGAAAQFIASVSQSPFVIAVVPVVNNGAVGGISIDAKGVLSNSKIDQTGTLRDLRRKAMKPLSADVNRASRLRKISLRRLEAALRDCQKKGTPVPEEIQFLAGMQRIRHVFVYPQQRDVVLAGYAEGWKVDDRGAVVGRTTGRPVSRLSDFIVALRSLNAAEDNGGIECSIDPTPEGLRRLQRWTRAPRRASPSVVASLEAALGPQTIRVSGVSPTTRFARVMVAADYQMKRLAMGLEPAPLDDLPSFLTLVTRSGKSLTNMAPRWWLATRYEPLLRDSDGLAWEIRGPGLRAMTEDGFLTDGGTIVAAQAADPQAKAWADAFTKRYDELSRQRPIFAELKNCVDLTVAAALIINENMMLRADYGMPLLLDEKVLQLGEYRVPKQVDSQASVVKSGRTWIVAVSGGVQINPWDVVNNSRESDALAPVYAAARPDESKQWWWD